MLLTNASLSVLAIQGLPHLVSINVYSYLSSYSTAFGAHANLCPLSHFSNLGLTFLVLCMLLTQGVDFRNR